MPYAICMTQITPTRLTVTAKGQVTLRRDILAHLGARAGDRLDIEALPGGRIEMRARRRTGKLADMFGALHAPDGPRLSLEDIDEAISAGWAGER